MSLKAFHFVFITTCIVLTLGCGVWALKHYFSEGQAIYLIGAFASLVSSVALALYECYFLRKLKHIDFL
ncbi:MAG: hypothetical protein C5B50_18160 [Verrucomicrobia bacterium]|nr:MAG: hypothetical protein C5B50_18160 [Verrucomicrobiota bacterium]